MTKTDAIEELIRDARRERSSKASYKRICKALAVLDTSGDIDIKRLLYVMEYADEQGNVYRFYTQQAA